MKIQAFLAAVTACLLASPAVGGAQATASDVTFTVPLNLKNVSSDIAKVAVFCRIRSAAITTTRDGTLSRQVEVPVTGGQLVTTVSVVVAVSGLDNPVGNPATYECSLTGFSTSLQRWDVFSDTHTVPAFRLTPTPAGLTGSFKW